MHTATAWSIYTYTPTDANLFAAAYAYSIWYADQLAARRPIVGGRRRGAVLVHVGVGLNRVVLRQVHLILPEDLAEGEPVCRRVAPAGQPRLVVLEDLEHVRVPDLQRDTRGFCHLNRMQHRQFRNERWTEVRRSTYGEFSDLDWLREGRENSGRLVHWQDEGDTRRWFAIAVFPIISFRYGEQLVERQAAFLGLWNDPMKVQFLHPSIDTSHWAFSHFEYFHPRNIANKKGWK